MASNSKDTSPPTCEASFESEAMGVQPATPGIELGSPEHEAAVLPTTPHIHVYN